MRYANRATCDFVNNAADIVDFAPLFEQIRADGLNPLGHIGDCLIGVFAPLLEEALFEHREEVCPSGNCPYIDDVLQQALENIDFELAAELLLKMHKDGHFRGINMETICPVA